MTLPDHAPKKQILETALAEAKNGLSTYERLARFAVGIPAVGQEALQKFMASMAIPEGRTKQETYDDALAEQKRFGTELVGFEDDENLDDLIDRMIDVFGQEAFDRCLVGKIIYDADHVLLQDNGSHYEVPPEDYVR